MNVEVIRFEKTLKAGKVYPEGLVWDIKKDGKIPEPVLKEIRGGTGTVKVIKYGSSESVPSPRSPKADLNEEKTEKTKAKVPIVEKKLKILKKKL